MSQSEKKIAAAKLLAEDKRSDEEIAEECGVVRRTLARWKLEPKFTQLVKSLRDRAAVGMEKAVEKRAFNTIDRLVELANLKPEATNGTITGQVRACQTIAQIRGEIVQLHGDVTERLKNKTVDELDFIAIHKRDPQDAEELKRFVQGRKQQAIQ